MHSSRRRLRAASNRLSEGVGPFKRFARGRTQSHCRGRTDRASSKGSRIRGELPARRENVPGCLSRLLKNGPVLSSHHELLHTSHGTTRRQQERSNGRL